MEDIELIIKIPKVYYEALRKHYSIFYGRMNGKTIMTNILYAVSNGIPLHKGHGRLIDADELLLKSEWYGERATYANPMPKGKEAISIEDIKNAPTIIESETKDDSNNKY